MKYRSTVVAVVLVGLLSVSLVAQQTTLQVIEQAISEIQAQIAAGTANIAAAQATLAKLIAERDRLITPPPPPPAPVDCVTTEQLVSTAWSGVCTPDSNSSLGGTEAGVGLYDKTVVQPAQNGGTCDLTQVSRPVTRECIPPVIQPPAPSGDFDTLCQSAAKLACYSLRDDAQLAQYVHSKARLRKVFYLYPNDPDPRRQDAAKITVDTSSNSLTNQIRLPIPAYTGSLLVQWDAWMGAEFKQSVSGIPTYKHFQLASGGNIWTEIRSRFSAATSGNVALVDLRYYGSPGPGFFVGNMDALSPMAGSFHTAPEVWTRYWAYLKPAGTYTELSLWVADVNRDPVQILDRALVTPRPGYSRWDSFWLEYNTSTDTLKAGRPDLISYARNVVMLQGISDPRPLLIRP